MICLWSQARIFGATLLTVRNANYRRDFRNTQSLRDLDEGYWVRVLFIADGTNLQYYTTHALGILTLAGGNITNQVFTINGVYYGWSATVNAGTPAGTVGAPYLALLGTGATANADSLANMVKLINFTGVSGVDYSSTVPGPNTFVTATSTPTTLTLTAVTDGSTGNAITTTISSGSF